MISAASRRSGILRRASCVTIEVLESRTMLSSATPASLPSPPEPIPPLPIGNEPLQGVVGTPLSLSPAMMNQMMGVDQIFYDFNGNVEQADGQGQTLAIVDAYGSPTITSDVETFDAHWGLSNADGQGNFFLTVQPLATTPNTITESQGVIETWSLETSLDVEWAHSIAPDAHIDLIEAPSDSELDLLDADVYAAALPGVTVVSNSWGGPAANLTEPDRYDGFLTTPQSKLDINEGVTFFFSSGDTGGQLDYPAASDQVVSVGGMTDDVSLAGNLLTIGDWADSGGGSDTDYTPPYNEPLVSLDADPLTGVWVYDSSPNGEASTGWIPEVGGTSLACPLWAAYFTTIDQGLVLEGRPTPTSPEVVNDIEIAGEGSPDYFITFPVPTGMLNTYPKWPTPNGPIPDPADIPGSDNTGFGQPNTELLTDLFISGPSSFAFLEAQVAPTDPGIAPSNNVTSLGNALPRLSFASSPSSAIAGQTLTAITVDVDTDTNSLNTAYTGAVTLSVLNGATLTGTVTVNAVGGVATFSNVAIDKTGSAYVLEATATGIISAESAPLAISPAATSQLIVTSEPTSTWQYSATTPVAITLEDQYGNIATTDTSSVVLGVAVGPGTFSGPSVAPVINGVATFTGLTFTVPGAYQLIASDEGLPPVATTGFDVVAIPVTRRFLFNGVAISAPALIIQQQRNAPVLTSQGPPPGVAVTFAIAGVQAAVVTSNAATASPAVAATDNDSDGVSQFLNSGGNLRSDDATAALLGGN